MLKASTHAVSNEATDKPAHVEFNLTVLGPSLAASGAPARVRLGGSGAAIG